jgi:RNA polymerase sigma factor (sigma-70 family)
MKAQDHIKYAKAVARNYRDRGLALADLEGVALLALVECAEGYREDLGRPTTYLAWHIRGACLAALQAAQLNRPRSPGQRKAWHRRARVEARMRARGGDQPSPEALAQAVGCSVADLAASRPVALADLDGPQAGAGESGRKLSDCISDSEGWHADPEALCSRAQESGRVYRALAIVESELSGRDRTVFQLRIAAVGTDQEKSDAEVAEIIGVSRQTVHAKRLALAARVRATIANLD